MMAAPLAVEGGPAIYGCTRWVVDGGGTLANW
jgi:hypothetical protein